MTPLWSGFRSQAQTLDEAVYYANYLDQNSDLFRETGGLHNGGVGHAGEVRYTCHDIGRHNVLDKLLGRAYLLNLDLADHVLFFSGRVSSEILLKVAKMNIPILVARSAPTELALTLAEDLNITVIGFARGDRLNIYTGPERIKLPPLLWRDAHKPASDGSLKQIHV
jgi:FdhD protein